MREIQLYKVTDDYGDAILIAAENRDDCINMWLEQSLTDKCDEDETSIKSIKHIGKVIIK